MSVGTNVTVLACCPLVHGEAGWMESTVCRRAWGGGGEVGDHGRSFVWLSVFRGSE